MDTDASLSSKGKDTNVADDGSLTSDIQELRNKVVELRTQELKRILATRDSVLKHLFYMNYMLSKSDSVETYTEIINDVNEKVDQAKLREFLQSHKLDPEKKMDSEKSPSVESNSSIVAGPNAAIPNTPEQSQNTQPISNSQTPTDQTTQPKKQKRVSLPPVERMVTRAASGAINPKSVDEILKDAERLGGFASSSASSTPPTPIKLNLQTKKQPQQRATSVIPRNGEGRQAANATIGGRGFEHAQNRMIDRESIISNYNAQPLYKLFQNPKKALTTEDWTVAREEVKMVRVLERIDQLKSQGLWSFQQIEPFRDPPRPYAHRDYLLDEMVWMQKDFKKERKWKIAAAFYMSRWVMEWHECKDDKEKRDALCVKAHIPYKGLSNQRIDERENTREASFDASDEIKLEPVDEARDLNDLPTSQVKRSSSSDEVMIDVESVDDDASTRISIDQTKDNDAIIMPPPIAPNVLQSLRQKVTSLSADAFLCCLEGPDGQVYDVDSIFPDLPTYEPPRPSDKDLYVDYIHYSRIMPISKRMHRRPKSSKNVRKRSISEDSSSIKKIKIENDDTEASGEQDSTASLFSSQNSPIHVKAPRPDLDTPCIWYPEDDELLMMLAKQFQYNWELIADSWNSTRGGIIGFPRTPWACYQRWAQKENLSRFIIHESETSNESSNETLVSDGAIDAPSSSSIAAGPSALTNIRPKRDMIPKKVSRLDVPRVRRNSSLLDVIKRSAKKRQDTILKQSQTRRNNDQPGQVVHQVPGPIELSKLKSESERRYQAALLEQRQVAALAFQSHVRAPTGIPYLAQGRPPIATSNQLQAYVMQQQQRQVNAIAVQQRHPTQQITSAMAQNQFYNVRMQQAQRAHMLQGSQTSSHQNQQQISQQHQQVGQQSPQQPQSQQQTIQSQTSQTSQQSQQTTQQQ